MPLKMGTAQGTITLDTSTFAQVADTLNRKISEAVLQVAQLNLDALAVLAGGDYRRMAWERRNGRLSPLQRPARAFKGGKVSMWLAWDRGRYRPVQRVTGYGWVFCDQWERYRRELR